MPPLTIAAAPVARCSGVTDMPWPKAMVMVLILRQWLRIERRGQLGQLGW